MVQLKKDINLLFATAVMTGSIIGSGIFVSPTSIVQNTGSVGLALLIWALSGLLTTPVVLCYAELGCLFPRSGGEYIFYRHVLGPIPAFLAAWVYNLVVLPIVYALFTLTTSVYLFYPFYGDCQTSAAGIRIFSGWILLSVAALNSIYVKYVARVQTFFTVVKVLALVIIIITGFVQIGSGKTETIGSGFTGTISDPGNVAVAIYSGFFTYSGWQYIFILLDEVKSPEKIVPQATYISMLSVTGLYILTNVAYFTVMSPEEMMSSPAVAVTFAERTLGQFSLVVPLLVACSAVGALNGAILGGSRMPFAAARDDMFPSVLSTINIKYFTPWLSLWFLCLLSLLYITTGEAVKIVEYLGFLGTLLFIVTLWCVLYLRWKLPDVKRPIKVPLPVVIFLFIVMIALAILGLIKQPRENGIGILIILSGIPAYIFGVTWKNKPSGLTNLKKKVYIALQKTFLLAPEEIDDSQPVRDIGEDS